MVAFLQQSIPAFCQASEANHVFPQERVDLHAVFSGRVRLLSEDAPSFVARPSVMVFLFLSADCPLCRSYSVILNRLYRRFGAQAVFYGMIPGRADPDSSVLAFAQKYHLLFPLYRDGDFSVTKRLHASITPQAIVLDGQGRLIYSGLIDDQVTGLGMQRAQSNRHYLEDALSAQIAGQRPLTSRTTPIGCLINMY